MAPPSYELFSPRGHCFVFGSYNIRRLVLLASRTWQSLFSNTAIPQSQSTTRYFLLITNCSERINSRIPRANPKGEAILKSDKSSSAYTDKAVQRSHRSSPPIERHAIDNVIHSIYPVSKFFLFSFHQ